MGGAQGRKRGCRPESYRSTPRGRVGRVCLPATEGTVHKTSRLPFFKKIRLGFLLILDIESVNPVESQMEVISALWSMFY